MTVLIISTLLWVAIGLLILVPTADEHKCVWCFVIMVAASAVMGPLVWVILSMLVVGRMMWAAVWG